MLQILQKQLDESTRCPLCQAAMLWFDAEQYDQPIQFHECSHCQHRVYQDNKGNCHCDTCLAKRKKLLAETRVQEQRKYSKKTKENYESELDQLSFINKLFLLSILDQQVREGSLYNEYIDWAVIKYHPISPNYLFQNGLIKNLLKDQILVPKVFSDEVNQYYLNIRLDGYSEPSLFSLTQHLRHLFFHNLTMGIPFKDADEVKNALYMLLYQEIIQFAQHYCRTWGIQIAGNNSFQVFCFRLMDSLTVGQIYYMIQNALEYLYKQNALKARNENFINTNLLKKTLEQYRERSLNEKWETYTLPRPSNIPLSRMSEILFYQFLGYDENIFFQPIWRSWKKIEPRLNFYSQKRCMHCGSNELTVEYDANDYVSLFCRSCKHQDHYFTR